MASWLDSNMAQFHRSAKNEYRDKLANDLEDGSNIATAAEYVAEYSSYLSRHKGKVKPADDHPICKSVQSLAEQAHMDVFYRCFPYTGQPYMLVTINPGFPDPYSYLKVGEGRLYNQVDTVEGDLDPAEMARIGAHHIVGWLKGTNLPKLFDEMVYGGSNPLKLSKPPDGETYLQKRTASYWKYHAREQIMRGKDWDNLEFSREIDLTTGFFNDFYYTTAYKFSTPDSGGTKSFTTEIEHDLRSEIECAQPKLVIAAGSKGWKRVYDAYKSNLEPLQASSVSRKISEAKRGLFKVQTDESPEYIVALKHPSYGGKYEEELIPKLEAENLLGLRDDS
jgi:hypothetical protein